MTWFTLYQKYNVYNLQQLKLLLLFKDNFATSAPSKDNALFYNLAGIVFGYIDLHTRFPAMKQIKINEIKNKNIQTGIIY